MKITIVTVGKVGDQLLAKKIDYYLNLLKREAKIEFVHLRDLPSRELCCQRILQTLAKFPESIIVALDEIGKNMTSMEFSQLFENRSKDYCFVIGGPDGLNEEVRAKADILLSLSKMTFTHEMACLLLTEQIFRGFSIINGSKYHRI